MHFGRTCEHSKTACMMTMIFFIAIGSTEPRPLIIDWLDAVGQAISQKLANSSDYCDIMLNIRGYVSTATNLSWWMFFGTSLFYQSSRWRVFGVDRIGPHSHAGGNVNGHQGSGIAYLFFVEERNLEVPSDLRDETEAKAVELIFVRR